MERVFSQKKKLDTVIIEAGIDIEDRLKIIWLIFSLSGATTAHIKDWNFASPGMLTFVNAVF